MTIESETAAAIIRDIIKPGEFHTYTEGRWTAVMSVDTDGEITKRRVSGVHGEFVENYWFDPDTGQWVLHGTSYGPDQVETWVHGELIANRNVADGYTMRTVDGEQRITEVTA